MTLVIGVLFWFLCPAFAAFFIKDDPEALAYGIRAAREATLSTGQAIALAPT